MNKNAVISSAVCGLLCAVSFLLPGAALALRDAALMGSVETVNVDEVELNLVSDLEDYRKLALVGDETASKVSLTAGKELSAAVAVKYASRYVSGIGFASSGYEYESADPMLYVGADGASMVVWEVSLDGDNCKVRAIVDDSSGSLLGLRLAYYPYGYDEAVEYMELERAQWPQVDPDAGPTMPSDDDQEYGRGESLPDAEASTSGGAPAAVGEPASDSADPFFYVDSFSTASSIEEYHYAASAFLGQFGLLYDELIIDGYYSVLADLPLSGSYVPVTIWRGTGSREVFYSINMGR